MEISKKRKPKPCLAAFLSILLATNAFADATARDLMAICGFQGPCADAVVGTLAQDNASSVLFSNAAGTDTIPAFGVDSSDDTVIRSDSGDFIYFQIQEDENRQFRMSASSDTAFTLLFGDGTDNQALSVVSGDSAGDDKSSIAISGGGAFAADGTRGSGIKVQGEEGTGAGDLTLVTGSLTGSDGFILLNHAASTLMIAPASTTPFATFNQTAATGGLTFAAGYGLTMTGYVPTLVAGTPTPGTHIFQAGLNVVPTNAAGNAGVLPASPVSGTIVDVISNNANEFNVCPGSGDTITAGGTAGSADVCVGVATLTAQRFVALSASAWRSYLLAAAPTPGN